MRQRWKIRKRYVAVILIVLAIIGASFWYIREFEVLPIPAYYLLNEIPPPTRSDHVLVVSPHPDDETIGAGGYIDRAEKRGAQVKIVVVTDGNKHGLKAIRHQEELKAMGILGVQENQVVFLDYPDGELRQFQDDFHQKLDQIVTDFTPTVILGTHPADIHPDHAVVGNVIDATTAKLTRKPAIYQFLVHYHRYPRPEGFHPTSYLLPPVKLISTDNPWQKFTLTPGEQNDKNEAVLQYKTQLAHRNPLLRGLLLSFVRQNELFVIVRPQ